MVDRVDNGDCVIGRRNVHRQQGIACLVFLHSKPGRRGNMPEGASLVMLRGTLGQTEGLSVLQKDVSWRQAGGSAPVS
jgi:hypothetical protein